MVSSGLALAETRRWRTHESLHVRLCILYTDQIPHHPAHQVFSANDQFLPKVPDPTWITDEAGFGYPSCEARGEGLWKSWAGESSGGPGVQGPGDEYEVGGVEEGEGDEEIGECVEAV